MFFVGVALAPVSDLDCPSAGSGKGGTLAFQVTQTADLEYKKLTREIDRGRVAQVSTRSQ
jgi:hypothetical protein